MISNDFLKVITDHGPILYRYSHIAKYWSKAPKFVYATCIQRPKGGDAVGNLQRYLALGKLESWATMCWRKHDDMLSRFDTIQERDERTDRQTDGQNS